MATIPCSAKHGKFCNAHHAWLMQSYWEEVERVATSRENEHRQAEASDVPLPLFRDWLKGTKGSSGNYVR